ncbi:MAG: YfhO family protein, partial [Rhodothermales bacterium]
VQSFVRQTIADLRGERAETFGDEILRALIFLALAGALLIIYQNGKIPSWVMQSAVVLLVVVDLWGVGRRYLNEERLVDSAEVEDRIATYDFDRFILDRQAEAGGPGHFRVLSLESGSPFTNARPSFHFESIGGYHGAKLRLIQDYIDHMFIDPETGLPDDNALDLLSVRYIIARGRLPGTQVVYQGEETGLYVLENSDAASRAYFVGEARVAEENEQIAAIRAEDFDARRTALVSEPLTTSVIDSSSTAEVELQSFSPREIRWIVNTDAPRLLVANEIYYPAGWEALVDGEEVPVHRVSYLLRGIEVPEGRHEVEMRFEPASHRLGLWISALATVLVYGLAVGIVGLGWYRRRQAARGVAV